MKHFRLLPYAAVLTLMSGCVADVSRCLPYEGSVIGGACLGLGIRLAHPTGVGRNSLEQYVTAVSFPADFDTAAVSLNQTIYFDLRVLSEAELRQQPPRICNTMIAYLYGKPVAITRIANEPCPPGSR